MSKKKKKKKYIFAEYRIKGKRRYLRNNEWSDKYIEVELLKTPNYWKVVPKEQRLF